MPSYGEFEQVFRNKSGGTNLLTWVVTVTISKSLRMTLRRLLTGDRRRESKLKYPLSLFVFYCRLKNCLCKSGCKTWLQLVDGIVWLLMIKDEPMLGVTSMGSGGEEPERKDPCAITIIYY